MSWSIPTQPTKIPPDLASSATPLVEPRFRFSSSPFRGSVTRLSGMDDELLIIHESWPGTTIGGEPGIVSGMLAVSRDGGGFMLNLAVGPQGGAPEECDYVEFPLSAGHAAALRKALTSELQGRDTVRGYGLLSRDPQHPLYLAHAGVSGPLGTRVPSRLRQPEREGVSPLAGHHRAGRSRISGPVLGRQSARCQGQGGRRD